MSINSHLQYGLHIGTITIEGIELTVHQVPGLLVCGAVEELPIAWVTQGAVARCY